MARRKITKREAVKQAKLVAIPGSVRFQKELADPIEHLTQRPFAGLKEALQDSQK